MKWVRQISRKTLKMKIYGHRGAAGLVLENTVASIQKAIELKVDGVEFDVRATKDGQAVIIHDETLERTHQIKSKIADLTLSEIQELTQGHEFPVPTLIQLMTSIGRKIPANVELKEIAAVAPSLHVLNKLTEANLINPESTLITSFDHSAVAMFREHTERYQLGLLTGKIPDEDYWQLAKSLDVFSVNISKDAVNADFVNQAHDDDRQVMVYTVNQRSTAEKLKVMGVDAIFSDLPDKVRLT